MNRYLRKLMGLLLAVFLLLSLAGCAVSQNINDILDIAGAVYDTLDDPAAIAQSGDAEKSTQFPDVSSTVGAAVEEDGTYTAKDDVALYIHLYGHLPQNFVTKQRAKEKGWEGGSVEQYFPGYSIGGDRFGNYEGLLPKADGRLYTECDIDTQGASGRGAKRIVFSNDGLIYYTEDHYASFTLLYGEE